MSMKAKILELLREKKDRVAAGAPESEAYVSGQELCEQFGVSRTAVWKAIGQLKKEGYVIEAVQNRGYRLLDQTEEVYNQADIQSRLKTKLVAHPLQFFDSIDSTNIRAKLEAEQGAKSGLLVVSDMQSAGRGRRGRSWESPAGTNIYYTLMLKPDFSSDCAPMLTLVMALAVAKGIRQTLRRDSEEAAAKVGIKWPNDIVVDGKKVCGILTEAALDLETGGLQYAIVGIGVNLFPPKGGFPPELPEAGAVFPTRPQGLEGRSQLAGSILNHFFSFYPHLKDKPFFADYRRRSLVLGQEITVLEGGQTRTAFALDLERDFSLRVRETDGTIHTLSSGEVRVRPAHG